MKRRLIITIALLFAVQISLLAQGKLKNKLYVDARLGATLWSFHAQAGVGYLFNKNHGIGLSYHEESTGSIGSSVSITGLGIDYRYATDFGLIVKIGAGKVLNGWHAVDYLDKFVYKQGRLFADLSIDYQIRPGFTVGIASALVGRMSFDRYMPASSIDPFPDIDTLVFLDERVHNGFASLAVTIGYAIPCKDKRVKK